MDLLAPLTINGTIISVPTTAATLYSLIEAASVGSTAKYDSADGLDITAENGDIRISLYNGLIPTASLGYIIKSGAPAKLRFRNLKNLRICSAAGSAVSCSITVGNSTLNETDMFTAPGGSGGGAGSNVGGNAATGTSVSGNPLLDGGRAATTQPTAVTDGQAVPVMLDKFGKVVTAPHGPRELRAQSSVVTLTASTAETTLIAAGGAGVKNDLTSLTFVNTSATVTIMTVRDATAGGNVYPFAVPPTDTRGISFPAPFKQTTANNNWTIQSSVSITDLRCVAQYIIEA